MPKPLPFPTGTKQAPDRSVPVPEKPNESAPARENPATTELVNEKPEFTKLRENNPELSGLKTENPELSEIKKETPPDVIEENCVTIKGQKIEIKPTQVKYFRNKTASVYGYLKQIPLTEFFTYGKGSFPNDERDADQILYDFLVAVFNDREFVRDNYNEITADEIDRIVKIFGRINHIDEKEEAARKNREAQAKH